MHNESTCWGSPPQMFIFWDCISFLYCSEVFCLVSLCYVCSTKVYMCAHTDFYVYNSVKGTLPNYLFFFFACVCVVWVWVFTCMLGCVCRRTLAAHGGPEMTAAIVFYCSLSHGLRLLSHWSQGLMVPACLISSFPRDSLSLLPSAATPAWTFCGL